MCLAGSLLACQGLDSWDRKSGLPSDHVASLDGVLHKAGYEDPYVAGNWCADALCHHINLEGGFAVAELEPLGEVEVAATPSCYQCHGKNWNAFAPTFLQVLEPAAGAIWPKGTARFIEWWGPPSDSTRVVLLKGNVEVEVLRPLSPQDGVVFIDPISNTWKEGDDYRILVEDNTGRTGRSRRFSICAPEAIPTIESPSSGEVLRHGTEMFLLWRCAAGTIVHVYLWRYDERVAVVRESTGNAGILSRIVPPHWIAGEGYRFQLIDEAGNEGFSEFFRIEGDQPVAGESENQPRGVSGQTWSRISTGARP